MTDTAAAPPPLKSRSAPLHTLPFGPGDPVPWFQGDCAGNPHFAFSTVAGRWSVLMLAGAAAVPVVSRAVSALADAAQLFDGITRTCFFVTLDATDRMAGSDGQPARLPLGRPGFYAFADRDGEISRRYRAIDPAASPSAGAPVAYRPYWLLLDPTLRVFAAGGLDDMPRLLDLVAQLPSPAGHAGLVADGGQIADSLAGAQTGQSPTGAQIGQSPTGATADAGPWAPVLMVPRVFEPGFCQRLIAHYQATGGEESGFMREIDGRTVEMRDYGHKRRADCLIEDETLRAGIRARIERRLLPELVKAFQYRATRIERYIVACYDGDGDGGYFRPHRDNTTRGTAHRRFAVTINLNTDAYQGGALRFPEFGDRCYVAPTGGAVVFSCSLLHEALPVTRGRRFACLPFLYDDEGARLRERNAEFLDDLTLVAVARGAGAAG